MKNSVAHFEIYTDDDSKLANFYTSLFDWSVNPIPGMNYNWVKTVDTDDNGMPTQPGGINGGMMTRPQGYNARGWMTYVNVESVDGSVKRAQELGAKVMKGKSAVPNMGWFAMLVDPEGNPFSVWQSDRGAK
jgi:predicted enzyme related to lactoylglutathione lyase